MACEQIISPNHRLRAPTLYNAHYWIIKSVDRIACDGITFVTQMANQQNKHCRYVSDYKNVSVFSCSCLSPGYISDSTTFPWAWHWVRHIGSETTPPDSRDCHIQSSPQTKPAKTNHKQHHTYDTIDLPMTHHNCNNISPMLLKPTEEVSINYPIGHVTLFNNQFHWSMIVQMLIHKTINEH